MQTEEWVSPPSQRCVWGSIKGLSFGHCHFCSPDTSDLHTSHWSPEGLGEGLPEAGGTADPSSCQVQGGLAGCRKWKATLRVPCPTASGLP